jgi:hypothetical protein
MRIAIILLFFLCVSASFSLKAQTNFLRGYYISTSKDSIRGYVDTHSEEKNGKVCIFKVNPQGKATKLYPKDIIGYGIDGGQIYERHTITTYDGEKMSAFFRVLVRGKLSLLRHSSRYYASSGKEDLQPISKYGSPDRDYGLQVMKTVVADCDGITPSMLEWEYKNDPDYRGIIRRYNRCVGGSFTEPKNIFGNFHVDFGIMGSVSAATLTMSGALEGVEFDRELLFGGGAFVSLFIPKVSDNIRVLLEGSFNRYKSYSYFSTSSSNNDVFVEYSYLNVPLIMRYNPGRVFFDVGFQNQFIFSQDLRWRIETLKQDIVETTEGNIEPLNSWSPGFIAGIGIKQNISNSVLRSAVRYSMTSTGDQASLSHVIEVVLSFEL